MTHYSITLGPVRLLSVLLLLFFNTWSAASTITASSSGVAYVKANAAIGSADMLQVRPANAAGISINKFEQFVVRDRALRVVNVRGSQGPAGLIVIVADHLVLENTLEGVGPGADILFLSPHDSGSVECRSCTFNNFNRVSLAVAETEDSLGDSSPAVGDLVATPSGSVIINGLTARGAISVDFLARKVNVSGNINTHLKADKSFFGGYAETANGTQLIGSGSINVLVGASTWNYDEQRLTNMTPTNVAKSIVGGTIRTVQLKIVSGNALDFNANVDTRTDILSTVRYRGKAHVVTEGITIQNFSNADLSITTKLSSEGTIALKSNGSLRILPAANIQGSKVELIAKEDVDNLAHVVADALDLAGRNIRNRGGRLEAFESLNAYAEKNLYNEFGARILGRSVALQAEQGFIRNGSRTPYVPLDSEVDDLLQYTWKDVENPDVIKVGTFYRDGMNVDVGPESERKKPADHSAFIAAQVLKIKAPGIENINPYWQRLSGPGPITLKQSAVSAVAISAQNLLEAQASKYFVNSSAIIQVNSSNGRMRLNARIFSNERYRAMIALEDEYVRTEEPVNGGSLLNVTSIYKYETKNYAYSPPGFISSLGHFDAISSVGFVNNASYLEVFGNANFSEATPTIRDIGITNSGITKTSITLNNRTPICHAIHSDTSGVNCLSTPITKDLDLTIHDPDSLDSLFFVHGDAIGKKASFFSRDESAFLRFLTNSLLERFTRDGLSVGQSKQSNTLRAEVRLDENDPDNIYLKSWYQSDSGEESEIKTSKFELITELFRIMLQEVRTAISNLFSELMSWWD